MSMFKIGQTSGVAPSTATEGEQLEQVDAEYLGKMAKSSGDLPEASLTPSKVVEVSDGCFSETETQVTDVKSAEGATGNAASGETGSDDEEVSLNGAPGSLEEKLENGEITYGEYMDLKAQQAVAGSAADSAADAAAAPNPDPSQQSNKEKQFQLSDLNPFHIARNPRTGAAVVKVQVPTVIPDLINDIPYLDFLKEKKLSKAEFTRQYCNNNPYPECALCKLSKTTIEPFDIHAMLSCIANGINALLKGGTNLFDCPGQLNAMLQNKLGPLGMVIGPAAAACIIGLSAVRGALTSFSNVAKSLLKTDLRVEVNSFIGKALQSGGGSTSFISIANSLLNSVGSDPTSLFLGTSIPRIDGWFTSGSTRVSTNTRRQASAASVAAATTALSAQSESMSGADAATENPGLAEEQGQLVPASEKDPHVACEDEYADPDAKYSKKVVDETTGEVTYVEIEVKPGESLETVRAQEGTIYKEEDNGMNSPAAEDTPYTPLEPDTEVREDAKYYYKDADGETKQVPQSIIDALPPGSTIEDMIDYMKEQGYEVSEILWEKNQPYPPEPFDPTPTYEETDPEDPVAITEEYYYINTEGERVRITPEQIQEVMDNHGGSCTIQDLIDDLEIEGEIVIKVVPVDPSAPVYDPVETSEKLDIFQDYYYEEGGVKKPISKSVVKELLAANPNATVADLLAKIGKTGCQVTVLRQAEPSEVSETYGKIKTYIQLETSNLINSIGTYYYKFEGKMKAVPAYIVTTTCGTKTNATAGDLVVSISTVLGETAEGIFYRQEYDIKNIVPHNKEYKGSGPLVLDNGLMIRKPVFLDAAQMQNCVETKSLVTETQVLASEMAKLNGINLTVEEISMAYILDHEANGSNLPADVKVEKITTVLDTMVV